MLTHRIALFFLGFVALNSTLNSAVIDKKLAASNNPSPCVLKVSVTRVAMDRIYAEAARDHALAKSNSAARSGRVQAATGKLRARTGIVALDAVAANPALGGGASVEPLILQDFPGYFDLLEPEIAARARASSSSVALTFNEPCSDQLVYSYKNLLSTEPEVSGVSIMPEVQITAEPLPPAKRQAPNDPHFIYQWDLDCTGQTISTDSGDLTCKPGSDIGYLTGKRREANFDAFVFLIDTGLWVEHPDFDQKRIKTEWGINVVREDMARNLADDHGHGTFTTNGLLSTNNNLFGAGTVSSRVYFVPVRAFIDGSTKYSAILRAIWWVPNQILKLKKQGINILALSSNSWITYAPFSSREDLAEMDEAVYAHLQAGAPFVSAAGNGANNNDGDSHVYPAMFAREAKFQKTIAPLIIVGASNANAQIANFSGYGWRSTSIAAPGDNTYGPIPPPSGPGGASFGNSNLRRFWRGTSMAQPKGSQYGIAELLTLEGLLAIANLRYRIEASGQKLPQLWSKANGGLLNLDDLFRADKRLPGQIEAVKVGKVGFNKAGISFRVPSDFGDDGAPRQLGLYDFRWSRRPINDETFWNATRIQVPWPKNVNETEEFGLTDLPVDSEVHFAFRAVDKGGNFRTTYLPPVRTAPVHVSWFESAYSFSSGWEFKNYGNYTGIPLFHFDDGRIVYKFPGGQNYDTSGVGFKENAGVALSPWQTVPVNGILAVKTRRNIGQYVYSINARDRYYYGDQLVIFIQREQEKEPKEFELARLETTFGFFEENVFSLEQFEGEKIRVGFKMAGLNGVMYGGVVIESVEIFGTLSDSRPLPAIPNSNFERGRPSNLPNAPNWLADLENWRTDYYICDGCKRDRKIPNDWFVTQLKGSDVNSVQEPSAMRLVNKTGETDSFIIATSDKIPIVPQGWYEVKMRARLSGNLLIIILGHTRNLNDSWLMVKEIEGIGWQWADLLVPFYVPSEVESISIRLALRGGQNNQEAIADLDWAKLDFWNKVFPENP